MMKRILTSGIFAVLLAMMVLLTGCTGNTPPSSESDRTTVDDSAPESITTADTSLEPATSEDTAPLPSTDPVTEETTAIPEVPEISAVISFDGRSEKKLKRAFAYENATELSMQTDEEGHSYITLTSTEANINPYILFNYTNFSKYFKADDIDVSQFPYVIIKMKCENITNGSFNLFYYCNSDSTIEATRMTNATYDNGNTDWQYILFDMSERVNWEGNLNGFRLDWCAGSAAAGESVSIAEIKLVQSDESYYKMFDLDRNSVGFPISDEAKQQAQELLGSVNMPSTAFDSYKPLTARHEDPTLQMWFDHMYDRTEQSDATSTGWSTYQLQMARNEAEAFQMYLAPTEADASGLKVYVTNFENAAGDTLETVLRWGYYFQNIDGKTVFDPLPPVNYEPDEKMSAWLNGGNDAKNIIPDLQKYNGFDIKVGQSQVFVVTATSRADSPAGEYTATVTVTDANGNEIKKATVFAYVWDFALPEASSCKTLADCNGYIIYATYGDYGANLRNDAGSNLYRSYYDFLLNYRINAYSLPFDNQDGTFSNELAELYLNNPRVQCFQTLGWKSPINATNTASAYEFLSQNPEWLEKAYFYPVDEPANAEALDSIRYYGDLLQQTFPGYKLIAPMHADSMLAGGDYFSYVADAVTAWCPHNYFFTTFAEWRKNPNLFYRVPVAAEAKFGNFRDRMEAEREGGDEIWWYLTRLPNQPEITLDINTEAVNYRTVFWQQKLYDVDGLLYYLVNDWTPTYEIFQDTQDEYLTGMDPMHEYREYDGIDIYGNGILIYCGAYFAECEPIPSIRLECVRDGIEDFEYLTMLEEAYGTEVVNAIISTWTTNMGEYNRSPEEFSALRTKLALLIEQLD